MALDINFDGLMLESHWDQDNAWSDAAQQVTPSALVQIMKDLKIREATTDEENYQTELQNLRAQIDIADQAILDTLENAWKLQKPSEN